MKRKTNLFYLSGDESNFITFSNYGESLTGNFLATNWKLFPSKFLCFYIKALDTIDNYNEVKSAIINYISQYYENKLAFLRDYCLNNNLDIEETLFPLNYLLDAIFKIETVDIIDGKYQVSTVKRPISNINELTDNVKLSFVGDITEQDYNGIYTDIINIIHSSDNAQGFVDYNSNAEKQLVEYTESIQTLYGWNKGELATDLEPIFDTVADDGTKRYYNILSPFSTLHLKTNDETNDDFTKYHNKKDIKFNVIVPLYDLIDISKNNSDVIDPDLTYVDLTEKTEGYIKNVPMGMWFTNETINLTRSASKTYAPSWSLLLSAQFKPFPYSRKMPNEITNDATKEAFATYSQVLIRQNKLMDKLETLSAELTALNTKLNNIEYKINNTGQTSVDNIEKRQLIFEKYIKEDMDVFKNEIYSYISNTWKGYIG